jgi:hypothetical protein
MHFVIILLIVGIIALFLFKFIQKTKKISKKIPSPEYSHHIKIQPTKAIRGYQNRYRKKKDPKDLLHVADVFNWGLPGLKPHKPVAEHIYTKLAVGLDPNDDKNRITKIEAHERLLQMHDPDEPILDPNEEHYQGPDNNMVPDILNNILNYDLNLPPTRSGKKESKGIKKSTKQLIKKYAPYKRDSNSVHDSSITQSVKKSIKHLKETTKTKQDSNQITDKLRNYILNECDPQEITPEIKEKAIKTLDTIIKTNGYVSNLEMKEMDVLNLVYNRIQQSGDPQIKSNLQETLVKELADAARGKSTVCTVGRVSRLVDTLNITDSNTSIKDTSTIRREMLNKANAIQQNMYKNADDETKKDLDAYKDTPRTNEYENKLKHEITNTLRKDYVDSGIMKEVKFNLELNKWIDDIV